MNDEPLELVFRYAFQTDLLESCRGLNALLSASNESGVTHYVPKGKPRNLNRRPSERGIHMVSPSLPTPDRPMPAVVDQDSSDTGAVAADNSEQIIFTDLSDIPEAANSKKDFFFDSPAAVTPVGTPPSEGTPITHGLVDIPARNVTSSEGSRRQSSRQGQKPSTPDYVRVPLVAADTAAASTARVTCYEIGTHMTAELTRPPTGERPRSTPFLYRRRGPSGAALRQVFEWTMKNNLRTGDEFRGIRTLHGAAMKVKAMMPYRWPQLKQSDWKATSSVLSLHFPSLIMADSTKARPPLAVASPQLNVDAQPTNQLDAVGLPYDRRNTLAPPRPPKKRLNTAQRIARHTSKLQLELHDLRNEVHSRMSLRRSAGSVVNAAGFARLRRIRNFMASSLTPTRNKMMKEKDTGAAHTAGFRPGETQSSEAFAAAKRTPATADGVRPVGGVAAARTYSGSSGVGGGFFPPVVKSRAAELVKSIVPPDALEYYHPAPLPSSIPHRFVGGPRRGAVGRGGGAELCPQH